MILSPDVIPKVTLASAPAESHLLTGILGGMLAIGCATILIRLSCGFQPALCTLHCSSTSGNCVSGTEQLLWHMTARDEAPF